MFLAYKKVKNTIADKNTIGNITSVSIILITNFNSSLSIGYLFLINLIINNINDKKDENSDIINNMSNVFIGYLFLAISIIISELLENTSPPLVSNINLISLVKQASSASS